MELDQMIFDDLIKCYKTKNYRFDFVSDELFVDGYSKGLYIHFEPLNRDAFLKYIEDTPFFFDMKLPMQKDAFCEAYMDFMDSYCSKNAIPAMRSPSPSCIRRSFRPLRNGNVSYASMSCNCVV